jgi:hypothetical protein
MSVQTFAPSKLDRRKLACETPQAKLNGYGNFRQKAKFFVFFELQFPECLGRRMVDYVIVLMMSESRQVISSALWLLSDTRTKILAGSTNFSPTSFCAIHKRDPI